jgi:copper oxidase (laccase) domain-containing protein
VIWWDEPGYVVAFTTRVGGVSEPPYDSLNLTRGTGDDETHVEENRRRACEQLGLSYERLAFNRQVHSPTVHRATPGRRGVPGDGLWTAERDLPLLAMSADCLPIAVGVTDGDAPKAAVIGPAIGPCCYEVGPEVARLFEPDLVQERRLDLWTAAERALRRAGVERVERVDLCTRDHPELFFSHRRDGLARGVQGVIGAVAG